jgi:hypothetical protein
MNNPKDLKLPAFDSASFASSYWPYRPNVDPAFILRYLAEDQVQPAVGAYLNYMAKVANLEADAAKAQADFYQALAKLQG